MREGEGSGDQPASAMPATLPGSVRRVRGRERATSSPLLAANAEESDACRYNALFLLVWTPAILAIPASITLASFGIYWAATDEDPERYVIAFVVSAALVLGTSLLRTNGSRVAIRAGGFAFCNGDATPTTEEGLRASVRRIVAQTGAPPTVVGSGWAQLIKRQPAKGTRLFLHSFVGRQPDGRWRSGTTIETVAKALLKEGGASGTTFGSHPTMDRITIGSWFSHANHGNTGDLSKGSSKSLKNARVLNMRTDEVTVMEYPQIRRLFDGLEEGLDPSDHAILDVAFQNLVPNHDVQKRGAIVDSPQTAADWLAPGAYLRVLFQGAARSYSIGVRWEDVYKQTTHRDPHFCSRFCLFTQVDVFSVVFGWHEPMSRYDGITSRYEANRWTPVVLLPIDSVAIVLLGIRNFEIIFKLDRVLDGNTLFSLSRSLIDLHKRIGGRSEIRYGGPAANAPVFLDCAVAKGHEKIFSLLRSRFGVTACALHPGKHTALSTAPLERVPVARMYGMEYGK